MQLLPMFCTHVHLQNVVQEVICAFAKYLMSGSVTTSDTHSVRTKDAQSETNIKPQLILFWTCLCLSDKLRVVVVVVVVENSIFHPRPLFDLPIYILPSSLFCFNPSFSFFSFSLFCFFGRQTHTSERRARILTFPWWGKKEKKLPLSLSFFFFFFFLLSYPPTTSWNRYNNNYNNSSSNNNGTTHFSSFSRFASSFFFTRRRYLTCGIYCTWESERMSLSVNKSKCQILLSVIFIPIFIVNSWLAFVPWHMWRAVMSCFFFPYWSCQ